MYKVFLVEDEVVIRKGIKNSIQWEKEGFVFAGEASDGELALPLIRKEKPDILITDIRMPFMDGLELSRLVRKDMPRIKIIILSGFNEFEYAKTAIDLGITQYLLKPINSAQLLEAVRKVAGQIDREREIEALVERDRLETEENRMREQNILFQHLVTGSYSTQELLDMADALQVRLSAPWYNIILLKIHSLHHADTEYSPTVIEIEEKMKQLCEQAGFILFDRNLEGKALLVRADTARELKEKQEQYVSALRSVLQVYPHVRYFGGIGKCVNRLHLLSESYEEASRCFAHRYLVSDNLFLESQSLAQEGLGSDSVALQDLDVRGLDRGRILEFLRTGDRGETKYFVGEFFRELKGSAMKSAMFRQYVAMDTYFCVAGFLEELGLDRSELELPENVADQFQGEETTLQYMVDLMEKALELRENAAGSRYKGVVSEVQAYIDGHYADEELSLNTLASHVNFSPNHLSTVFSQETGVTFIKYLTDYRMNKAKELLRCTGKKSGEISQEVGYKDPHYFSYLFKKTQGMTPTQFRGRKESEENDENRT